MIVTRSISKLLGSFWPSVQAITEAQNKSSREAVLRSDAELFVSDMDVAMCLAEQLQNSVADLAPSEAEEATDLFDCALLEHQAVEQVQSSDGTLSSQESVVITQDAADQLAADLERYRHKPIPPIDYTQGLTAAEYNNGVIPESGPFPTQREALFYAFHLLILHGWVLEVLEANSRNPDWDSSASMSSLPTSSRPSTPSASMTPSTSASSIKRGRTASAEQDRPKPKRAKTPAQLAHKKRQGEMRTARKLEAEGSDTITLHDVKVENIPTAEGGWQGSRALMRSIGDRIVAMWHKRTLGEYLSDVTLVAFKNLGQLPTKIFDRHGRLIIYRTPLTLFINPALTVLACHTGLSPFMAQFIYEAQKFVMVVTYEYGNEVRGLHFFQISGHDRNNKQRPMLRAWHREPQNMRALSIFFRKGGPMARLTMYVNKTLDQFPGLRARLFQVKEYMEETYGISPMYGLFWNFCLNWGRGSTFVRCLPHVDAMNVAIGVCAIFIMGIFDSNESCWLCFWDLKIFIQLPPGVVLTYPSALFYHFNYDLSDLRPYLSLDRIEELSELLRDAKITGVRDVDIVVSAVEPTQETRHQCTVLGEGEDDVRYMRSSGVLFTQATMFQTAELKINTMKMAKKAGMDTECKVGDLKEKGMYWE